eukprot:3305266-Pyramimonas_sp.AAC.1
MVAAILAEARKRKLNVVFALTRAKLGKVVAPRVRVSCVSILDHNGADDQYKKMVRGRPPYINELIRH